MPPGWWSTVTCMGDVWAGPYLALRPQLAFVSETSAGVEGYIVGTEDTAAFAIECDAQWWPALRARYPDPPDDRELTPDQVLHQQIHHPPGPPPDVLVDYPAHLHVNLLPRLQGRGVGRRLLETLFDALVDVPGVHLGVAPRNGSRRGVLRPQRVRAGRPTPRSRRGLALGPPARPVILPDGIRFSTGQRSGVGLEVVPATSRTAASHVAGAGSASRWRQSGMVTAWKFGLSFQRRSTNVRIVVTAWQPSPTLRQRPGSASARCHASSTGATRCARRRGPRCRPPWRRWTTARRDPLVAMTPGVKGSSAWSFHISMSRRRTSA